jgi:acyl-CoA synthetase (AMP-forming)/AMP-acid ligase II
MAITDKTLPEWDVAKLLPPGEIGEIVVEGPIVSPTYVGAPKANALAKMHHSPLPDQQSALQIGSGGTAPHQILHRTGDLGYLDAHGRLWFCGRKAHRVETKQGTLYTEPCEGIFNAHPLVRQSALVGVRVAGDVEPALCVEPAQGQMPVAKEALRNELLALGARHPQTQTIRRIFFHPRFPVDIRHNSKIVRERLARWVQKQVTK